MDYKGFTIIHRTTGAWIVRVNVRKEYLATSKENAMRTVDGLIARSLSNAA